MPKKRAKYYVVWEGRKPGIYPNWLSCKEQIEFFTGAKFQSFLTKKEAEYAWEKGWKFYYAQQDSQKGAFVAQQMTNSETIHYDSISVDAATKGNPGPMAYRGVDTKTGEILFSVGPIAVATNNIGEFLAVVHAIAYLKKLGRDIPIYSDSVNAINWVKNKKARTKLPKNNETAQTWALIKRAEKWLDSHPYSNEILKWQTREWGEIKADYGRK